MEVCSLRVKKVSVSMSIFRSHCFKNRRAERRFSTIKYLTLRIMSILIAGNTFVIGLSLNPTGNKYNVDLLVLMSIFESDMFDNYKVNHLQFDVKI